MVTDMKIELEAARTLTYETSRICDLENNNLRVLELGPPLEKDEEKRRKQLSRALKRLNGMLTPMCKYYASEMCNRVANTAIQVLGGSGYMKDYAAERYLRDARITNIYEGTSQLQVVAAVRGVISGGLDNWVEEYEKKVYGDPLLDDLKAKLIEARQKIDEVVPFIKSKGNAFIDLSGRRLVDGAISIIIGHLFLGQGAKNDRKKHVAKRFITRDLHTLEMNCKYILTGDATPLEEYALLAGPVPVAD
jgi:rhodanese-related sulfurtransferase